MRYARNSAVGRYIAMSILFALDSMEYLPLEWRISNAIVTYVDYIRQMFWPVDLVPFYVHPEDRLEIARLIFALLILVAITAIVFVRRRKNPYLLIGWLWYLVMLIPVMGVIQSAQVSHRILLRGIDHVDVQRALPFFPFRTGAEGT